MPAWSGSPGSKPSGKPSVQLREVATGRVDRRRVGRRRPRAAGPWRRAPGGRPWPGPSTSRSRWRVGQRRDQPLCELLGAVVELDATPRRPAAVSVATRRRRSVGSGATSDEALLVESTQQPGQVARVQGQAFAQLAYAGAVRADLEQQPGHPERASGAEERLVERADALGVRAVEPPQGLGVADGIL